MVWAHATALQAQQKLCNMCITSSFSLIFTVTRFSLIQVLVDLWVGGASAVANIAFKAPIVWRQFGAWLFLLGLKAGQQVFREKALVIASGSQES